MITIENRMNSGPRERAKLEGVAALSDSELIALLLGSGTTREPALVLATAILEEYGGLAALARSGPGNLETRSGVGTAKAMRLCAAFELGKRSATSPEDPLAFADSARVAAWATHRLGHLDHEELWMLALDGRKRLRGARCVARGGLHGIGVQVRDPLRMALRDGASGIVLIHNHPSGNPSPSPEDIDFTCRFAEACEIVATPLIDHVIVAGALHTSLLSLGYC